MEAMPDPIATSDARLTHLLELGYEKVQPLLNSEGANSYAFSAFRPGLSTKVFIKATYGPPSAIFREPSALKRALGTGTANVVRVVDAWVHKDELYVVQDYVDGISISELLAENPLGVSTHCALQIAEGLLNGVSHLHSCGMLHRDIKPGNVMLDSSSTPLLADFGSADSHDSSQRCPASAHTALYRPPEAWGSQGWFSKCSDVYQVGMVFAQLVHGPLSSRDSDYLDRAAKKDLRERGASDDCQIPWDVFKRA
jgi:serine/threonine protein kinase